MGPADGPRIALIHALAESIAPVRQAFSEIWPQANCFDLLDTSLATDLAAAGALHPTMVERFRRLSQYAAGTPGHGPGTAAILFTCSAFGPAIEAAAGATHIPVFKPNEAAFAEALGLGASIGLVVTFPPSLASLTQELLAMAARTNRSVAVCGCVAEEALDALKSGDPDGHDRLVAQAVATMPEVDVVVLGQFSLARAADTLEQAGRRVITTPQSAVRALKRRLDPGAGATVQR